MLTPAEIKSREHLRKIKPRVYDKCLQFTDQLKKGKSIALIQLQYKYLCNFHCSHCAISSFRTRTGSNRRLDIPTVQRVYDEADEYGLAHTGISGGEPLVFKDLELLIKAIGPDRFHIQLDTNGWLFTPRIAKHMKSLGIDKVQISIDGLDAKEHDDFRNKPGSHKRCMESIDATINAGLAVQVATVVGHERAKSKEFEDFMKLMYSLKAPVSLVFAKPVGEYTGRQDLMCTPEDMRHVEELLKQYGGYDHIAIGYDLDLGCIAVKRCASITAFGDVLPCPWMYMSLGNVFDSPLADILNKGMKYFSDYSPVCRLSESPEFGEKYLYKIRGDDLLPIEDIMGGVDDINR